MKSNDKDNQLQDELVDEYKKETIQLYQALLKVIAPLLTVSKLNKLNKVLAKELKEIGTKQVAVASELLTMACLTKIKDKKLINKIIKENWSEVRFSDRIYKEKKLLEKVLKKELKNCLKNEEDIEEIIRRVSRRLDISVNNAKRLIDTELSHVIGRAELAKGEKKGHKFYKIVVTLDSKTSPICKDIHERNETFRIGTPFIYGVNMVPAHPHCRSRIETF